MNWKAAVSAETDLERLVAFATHAVESAKRESPEIREAQHSLRVEGDDHDLEAVRSAVMRIAVEAADIIDEKRFFGDRSVSTDDWDEFWSGTKPKAAEDTGPWYYIHYVAESCRTPYGALGDVARVFKAPHTYKEMNLCCFENGEHRVMAVMPRGAKYYSMTSLITDEEREVLGTS